jgi:lysylphosphatidylglycerol synthetase-like protein (DUF2156 family)
VFFRVGYGFLSLAAFPACFPVTTTSSIPVAKYLPKAVAAGVAGVAVGVGACAGLGGESQAMIAAGSVVAIAAALGVIPAILPPLARTDRFGLAILAGTMAQTLLAIAAAFALTTMFELPRRPLVLGSFAGVFVVMMLQAVAAALLLNSMPSHNPVPGSTSRPSQPSADTTA